MDTIIAEEDESIILSMITTNEKGISNEEEAT